MTAAQQMLRQVRSWFDTREAASTGGEKSVHWARLAPFVFLHLGCLGVIWVGWSPFAAVFAVAFYLLRAFFVTGFYHRYFSHRAYRTSRAVQFLMALAGNSAVQRGPLWWAAHHRHHHRTSDHEGDPHSPHVHGFWWSHLGWLTDQNNFPTDLSRVPDLARYPELRWLDRYDTLVPLAMAGGLFGLGHWLEAAFPGLGTSGWHNNHHRYPGSARNGFTPLEIDPTYYLLKLMAWVGLIRDLHPVPAHVMEQRRRNRDG